MSSAKRWLRAEGWRVSYNNARTTTHTPPVRVHTTAANSLRARLPSRLTATQPRSPSRDWFARALRSIACAAATAAAATSLTSRPCRMVEYFASYFMSQLSVC
uniref:Uncharacterized protein n=1 Tax=Plectus sambesii TaxID=2011161 RepID=A0A914W1P8_9BILA